VRTQTQFVARAHAASPALRALEAPREPPRAPVIGDLTGDGRPEVVTVAGERIYAWRADGTPLRGFPVNPDPERANCAPSEQDKTDDRSHPKCGFLASPAFAQLDAAPAPKSIVVPGLDGRLRAYRADGTVQPGFPVRLRDETPEDGVPMTAESINAPAVGDFDGDGRDEIVAATNEVYGGDSSGGDVSFAGALASSGAASTSRVYAVKPRGNDSEGGAYVAGWPIELPGIIQNVLPLIGPGHDPALVDVDGAQRIVVSTTGGALSLFATDGTKTREFQQQGTPGEGALNLFEYASVGDVDGGGTPDVVKYQIDLGQAANLLLVGQNFPYSHRIGAFDAGTGLSRPGFPVITDDYQFLSSSTVAKVAPGTSNQVLAGTGLGLLHAYDGRTGRDVAGFPKTTGGWLFAPAAVSTDERIAAITREGYLFEWSAPGTDPCQAEWPSFRHDEQGTGDYDADGTPPAAPEELGVTRLADGRFRVAFTSPGDDGLCGTATRYVADVDGRAVDLGEPVAGGEPFARELELPAGATLTVRASDGPADRRSNLGPPASAAVPGADAAPGTTGGAGAGGTTGGGATDGGAAGGGAAGGAGGGAAGGGGAGTGGGAAGGGGADGGAGAPAGPTGAAGAVGTAPAPPGARVCASRRVITVRLPRALRRIGVRSVRLAVTGRRTVTLRGDRTRVRVSLRGLPRGRVRVRMVVRGADGRSRTLRRSFLACTKRR
jgi:hypothetical protein